MVHFNPIYCSRQAYKAAGLLVLLLVCAGCDIRVNSITTRQPKPVAPLKAATLDELVSGYNRMAEGVQSLNLKVDLAFTAPANKKSKTKCPADLICASRGEFDRSSLFIEKPDKLHPPDKLRMYDPEPLIGHVFDLASDGNRFELFVPKEDNTFYLGRNDVPPNPSDNPLMQLRPAVILNALPITPISNTDLRESLNDHADSAGDARTGFEYAVQINRPGVDNVECPVRRIVFSRYDLLPKRQTLYDSGCKGLAVTQVTYEDYKDVQGVQLPWKISINRPYEGFTLDMTVDSIELNKPIDASQFTLAQPPGSKLVNLADQPPSLP